jgi:hypothetical protein
MANTLMYYDGAGTQNMAIIVEAAGQGNTVTAVTPSSTYWVRTGYTNLSRESLFTWDNWTPTNNDCPWTMAAPIAPAKKVITNMPPRYMWGQALMSGPGSSAYNGGLSFAAIFLHLSSSSDYAVTFRLVN